MAVDASSLGLVVYCIVTNGTFRDAQMSQDKAQVAVNGYPLNKDWNAVLSHLWASLRARREAVICAVASFEKDQPFPARRAWQLTASRHAESTIGYDAVH